MHLCLARKGAPQFRTINEEENENTSPSSSLLSAVFPGLLSQSFPYLFPHQTVNSCSNKNVSNMISSARTWIQAPFHRLLPGPSSHPFLISLSSQRTSTLQMLSCGLFGFVSPPFIGPLPVVLKALESTTQGSRTKRSPPKSVVPQRLPRVSEEGSARKILIGRLER